MEKRISVLWLPAWFPSKQDFLNGDFIERHAHAVSKYADVTVIYVVKNTSLEKKSQLIELVEKKGLRIYIGQYNNGSSFGLFSKFWSSILFFLLQNKIFKLSQKNKPLYDLVHVHISQRQGLFAHFLRIKRKLKFVITEQNSWFMPFGNKAFTKSYFLKKLVKANFKFSSGIHTVSKSLGNELKKKYSFIKNFTVIPNVVNNDIFYLDANITKNELVYFFAITGNIYHKNTDGLIRAFNAFLKNGYKAQLHIAGPNTDALKKLVNDFSISDDVFFNGSLPYTEVAKKMQACDAFIFFTRYETFGCVMAEALSCGKPLIATDIAVLKENLTHNENAIIIENENELELQLAMQSFCNNHINFNSIKIEKDAHEKYNYNSIGQHFFNFYKDILLKK